MDEFLQLAVDEALKGIKLKHGAPFGAVIVKNKKVVVRAHNHVLKNCDPTAHAEIIAIRKAAKKLKSFDLSGCVLYSSCEPCPMCFAAIHWAGIKKVYYGACSLDAGQIGFDDELLYEILNGNKKPKVKMKKLGASKDYLEPLRVWAELMKSEQK